MVKIRTHVTGKKTHMAKVRDRLLVAGAIINTASRVGYFNLALPDTPDETRSRVGTGWERLSFPSPDGATEPSRSPVPYVSRNGVGNGTASDGPGPSHDRNEHVERDNEESRPRPTTGDESDRSDRSDETAARPDAPLLPGDDGFLAEKWDAFVAATSPRASGTRPTS